MAAIGNASSQYLDSSTTTPLTSAYSWAFWYHPNSAPVTGAVSSKHPFSFTNSTGTAGAYDLNFAWDHPDGATYKAAVHRNSGGTFALAQHPGTPASGAWHHVAAVFNGSTLKLYYDGVEVASVAASAPTGVAGDPEVTIQAYNKGASGFDNQAIAEHAIWSVALTAAEVLSLAQGAAVTSVQSGSIAVYNKLNTGDLTTTGPALTNHSATVNTTYFFGTDGGIAIGGANLTATTIYNWLTSGGIAIGGANLIATTVYNWTPSGGVAVGGADLVASAHYNWTPTGGIAIGGVNFLSPTVYHWTMSGGIAISADHRISLRTPQNAYVIATGLAEAFTTK